MHQGWEPVALCCCCSVTQSDPTFCNRMHCSSPGFPVLHRLLEFAQTHVRWVGDAIQPSHTLSPSPSALNLSQHQVLFQWVSSSQPVVLTPQKSAPHPSRPHKQVSEWLRLHRAVERGLRGVQPWLCPIWGWRAWNGVDAVIGLRGLQFSDLEIRNWTK